MRFRSLFFLMVFLFFLIGSTSAIVYLVISGQDSFENQIEDYLISVISMNKERVGDFIFEMEGDSLFLSGSEKTKEIFRIEVGESEYAAKLDVAEGLKIITKEIGNYIREHPDMTLDDLKDSSEFQVIAVQQAGKEGYSALLDVENMVTHFHVNPKAIGVEMSVFAGESNILNIVEEASVRGFGEGYYDWVGVNGNSRKKYAEGRLVGVETADGVQLLSVTTAYIDDYITSKNVPESLVEHFEEFSIFRNYYNVLFISADEKVVFMSNPMEGLGFAVENLRGGLKDLYLSFADSEEDTLFYGPFFGHFAGDYLQIAVVSRVYDGDEFVGVIMLVKDIRDIASILEESGDVALGFRDEDYLINEEGLLITPLKSRDVDLMVQEIRTDNTEECLGDFAEAKRVGLSVEEYDDLEKEEGTEMSFFLFYDFKGDLTLGLHRPIGKVNWCLLSEINFDKILGEPMEKSFKKQIVFRTWVFLGITLLLLGMASFIDKGYVLKRKKEKAFRENFFTRLSLGYYILFATIFIVAYFFIVTSFFQGWQNSKLFDNIPDMFVFIVGFMIFAVGVKIRKMKARYLVMYGGLMICLRRVLDIPLQEWQLLTGQTLIIWVPILAIELTGFLLLLIGFRRLKYGI